MMRLAWILLGLMAGAAVGCAGPVGSGSRPAAVDRVDGVVLESQPVAIDLDGKPGADGVRVRLHFYQVDAQNGLRPVGVLGTVEILLFEGKVQPEAISATKPFHIWQFTASQLQQHQGKDNYGLWCYDFVLNWGQHVPSTRGITLSTRYTPRAGQPIYAPPTTVAMSP